LVKLIPILLRMMICKWNCVFNFWGIIHYWNIETQLIFICWFCTLQLCWVCSLVLEFFLMMSLGFSTSKIMLLAEIILLLLSDLDAFYFFISCLMFLARMSSTLLTRSGESEHPCLVPDLSRKAFSLSPVSVMLLWTFPIWLLLCGAKLLSHLIWWAFFWGGYLDLNSGRTPYQHFFVKGFFEIGSYGTICPCWLWTTVLLFSASWVGRITGVSHQCLAW
jgi:hypothetical protein